MAAAALPSGGDRPGRRRTLAFSLSLLIHFAFVVLIFGTMRREVVFPPLEISIVEGTGTAEAEAAEGSAGAEALRSSRSEAKPVEAAATSKVSAVTRPRVIERAAEPATRPVAEPEPQAASPSRIPAPISQPLGVASSSASPGGARADGTTPTEGPGRERGASRGDGSRGGGFSVSGGGRSYASIWAATQRYLAGLRWAYNSELNRNAGLRGVIVVRYEILADGAVGDVAMLSSELRTPRLERQVLSQIRDWRYPPESTGTVVVTWPFSFRPPR